MAKAKPIKDMNGTQWNRYESLVVRKIMSGDESDDRELAVSSLNAVLGRRAKDGGIIPPGGGYQSELVDGAKRLVEVRRKQLTGDAK